MACAHQRRISDLEDFYLSEESNSWRTCLRGFGVSLAGEPSCEMMPGCCGAHDSLNGLKQKHGDRECRRERVNPSRGQVIPRDRGQEKHGQTCQHREWRQQTEMAEEMRNGRPHERYVRKHHETLVDFLTTSVSQGSSGQQGKLDHGKEVEDGTEKGIDPPP